MRFSTYIALFTSSAAAQSSVSLFNLFEAASTLTQIGADATATTYKHECPPDNAGITGVPSQLRESLSHFSRLMTDSSQVQSQTAPPQPSLPRPLPEPDLRVKPFPTMNLTTPSASPTHSNKAHQPGNFI